MTLLFWSNVITAKKKKRGNKKMTRNCNNIVNIINFVRGWTPKKEDDWQLLNTVKEEMGLMKRFNFPGTFLLQYDALKRDEYIDYFKKEADDSIELGIWIEVVQPLVKACGLKWRGKEEVIWDWHINPGFLMSYTQKERELLCDEQMRYFKERFGYYPETVGSWLLDSYSMEYLSKKYDIKAFCICREQLRVDAYTLCGGYYNQGYYPSKYNMLCPAQTEENMIKTPVFRMLGIDPIYEYDKLRYKNQYEYKHPIYTFEPDWTVGRNKELVGEFLKNYFNDNVLGFSYIQVGQENSFWWYGIESGWNNEAEVLVDLREKGTIRMEKLSESGEWFKKTYSMTPATSICAQNDWGGNNLQAFWYNCKNYRCGVIVENDKLIIRDIYKFDERYKEAHYSVPEMESVTVYDNLPVVDSILQSNDLDGGNRRCGMFFDGCVSGLKISEEGSEMTIEAKLDNEKICIRFTQKGVEVRGNTKILYKYSELDNTKIKCEKDGFSFAHNGFEYFVPITADIEEMKDGAMLKSRDDTIFIDMEVIGK